MYGSVHQLDVDGAIKGKNNNNNNRLYTKITSFELSGEPELGTQHFFSFATMTAQQRIIASGASQGPEKNQKIVRPQCLDGVATINIVKWQLQTTLWPDNMVTLSRQNCRA